jgi:hypothetical protein
MKTLLSIDLDYFGNNMFPFQTKKILSERKKEYTRLFSLVSDFKNKGGEVFLVESHEEILELFNDYRVGKLINIDYHSDTVDETFKPEEKSNLATWVNFYAYKEECEYEWRYPCFADCIMERKGLIQNEYGHFFWTKKGEIDNGFKKNIRRCGFNNLEFGEIQSIGIATSWATNELDNTNKFSDISILEKFINEYSVLFDDEVSIEIIKDLRFFIEKNKERN